MKPYTFNCSLCGAPLEVHAPTRADAERLVRSSKGWRRWALDGHPLGAIETRCPAHAALPDNATVRSIKENK